MKAIPDFSILLLHSGPCNWSEARCYIWNEKNETHIAKALTRSSDVLHFALNHGFVAFVLGGFDEIPQLDWSELWSLPGILRAAIHASFVLLRDRLINICNDTALSYSTHTDAHLMFQGDGAFVLSAQDEQASKTCSVQQCCAATQWLLRIIVILLHSSAAKLNTLPYWSLPHSSESGPGQENDKTRKRIKSNASKTGEYFSTAVTQPWNLSNSLCTAADFHSASGPRPYHLKPPTEGGNHVVQESASSWQKLWGAHHTKKIIACQHRLSGLSWSLWFGSVGAEEHGKQGRPSPAQSLIINMTVMHQQGFKGQEMISVNGRQCENPQTSRCDAENEKGKANPWFKKQLSITILRSCVYICNTNIFVIDIDIYRLDCSICAKPMCKHGLNRPLLQSKWNFYVLSTESNI